MKIHSLVTTLLNLMCNRLEASGYVQKHKHKFYKKVSFRMARVKLLVPAPLRPLESIPTCAITILLAAVWQRFVAVLIAIAAIIIAGIVVVASPPILALTPLATRILIAIVGIILAIPTLPAIELVAVGWLLR